MRMKVNLLFILTYRWKLNVDILNFTVPKNVYQKKQISYFDLNPLLAAHEVLRLLIDHHSKNQLQFLNTFDAKFVALENQAQMPSYQELKNKLKNYICSELINCPKQHKLIFLLVDLQNDFVLEKGALYVPDGEKVILNNMAYLDALFELIHTYPIFIPQLMVVTTQDTHIIGRKKSNIDYKTLEKTDKNRNQSAKDCFEIEANEILYPLQAEYGCFGPHCVLGTPGIDFPTPIVKRLNQLPIELIHFGKINFSPMDAGMQLIDNVVLSKCKDLRLPTITTLSFKEFFKQQAVYKVHVAGVCAEICVQYAALGIAHFINGVKVIDELTQYLDDSQRISTELMREKKNVLTVHLTDKAL